MRWRVCWAVGVFTVLHCTTGYVPPPSLVHPFPMCEISCGRGAHLLFTRQHLCSGGASRYMRDVVVVGTRTERNEDGTIKSDVWITLQGDYPKTNVETMPCSSYVAQLIASRPAEQRGQFPGERPDGTPDHK